eukprot:871654-Prymnesium_polylepis.1
MYPDPDTLCRCREGARTTRARSLSCAPPRCGASAGPSACCLRARAARPLRACMMTALGARCLACRRPWVRTCPRTRRASGWR